VVFYRDTQFLSGLWISKSWEPHLAMALSHKLYSIRIHVNIFESMLLMVRSYLYVFFPLSDSEPVMHGWHNQQVSICIYAAIYPSIHSSMGSAPVGVQCPLTYSLGEFPFCWDWLWYSGLSPVLMSRRLSLRLPYLNVFPFTLLHLPLDFIHLFFTVVGFAPRHQPSFFTQTWDRHMTTMDREVEAAIYRSSVVGCSQRTNTLDLSMLLLTKESCVLGNDQAVCKAVRNHPLWLWFSSLPQLLIREQPEIAPDIRCFGTICSGK